MMNHFKRVALISLIGSFTLGTLGIVKSAEASLISFSTDWRLSARVDSFSNTDNRTDLLTSSSLQSINKFDSNLGTLTGINIKLIRDFQGGFTAKFKDDDLFSRTAGLQELTNVETGILGLVSMGPLLISHDDISHTCAQDSIGSSECNTRGNFNLDFATVTGNIHSDFFGKYIGTDSLNFLTHIEGNLWTDETDGDDGYVDARTGGVGSRGFLTITYTFDEPIILPPPPTSVSEPIMLGLFTFSTLFLFVRKRILQLKG